MNPKLTDPYLRPFILQAVEQMMKYNQRHSGHGAGGGVITRLVNWLWDDTPIADDPSSVVGIYLVDGTEGELLKSLAERLGEMGDRIGWQSPDALWLAQPEWPQIEHLAHEAAALMRLNDQQRQTTR